MSNQTNEREQKFISLYQMYIDEVYRYVYLRVGLSQALAEDITQEIFLSVYRGFDGFKGLCSERTWIYKITKNKMNDFYRKEYSKKFEFVEMNDMLSETLPDPKQDIQEMLIESFEKEKVRTCLNSLTEQYRIILILKYMDDKSVKEIASVINKSPKAIESILQRAKSTFIKNYKKISEEEGM